MFEPKVIDGKYYVEMPTYGVKYPYGAIINVVKEHFAGREITALEIGVAAGYFSENFYEIVQPKEYILVDPWDIAAEPSERNYMETWFRIQGKKGITAIKATSETAARILSMNFDFVYIDGDHTGGDLSPGNPEDGIRMDIKLWLPRMNKGGIISGHDYNYDNIRHEVNKVFGDRVNYFPKDNFEQGGIEWWVFT